MMGHLSSSGSWNSKMHEEIMLVPKVAMRQPTAGPTAEVIVASPAPTLAKAALISDEPEPL
jgi:hypothetical protein